MKLSANPGDQVPQSGLADAAGRLRALEQELREFRARAGELTGAVIRRGLLKIIDGGGLTVEGRKVDYTEQAVLDVTFTQYLWGALSDNPRPDGSPQQGLVFRRDDGTPAFEIREANSGDGQYAQAWLFRDRRAGNIVLSEDTNSGMGLARPHLTYPAPQPTNTAQWLAHTPAAGDTSWTSIARCEPEPENPRMAWNVSTLVDAGVTAEYRWCWQLDAGVQAPVLLKAGGGSAVHTLVGDDPTTGYRFGYWRELNVPLPSNVTVQRRTTLDLQVRITAGADGTKVAKASVVALGGDQS